MMLSFSCLTFSGGGGNDTISDTTGNATITGGAGADTITGGAGVDSITGGTGDDTFDLETIVAVANRDTLLTLKGDVVGDVVEMAFLQVKVVLLVICYFSSCNYCC